MLFWIDPFEWANSAFWRVCLFGPARTSLPPNRFITEWILLHTGACLDTLCPVAVPCHDKVAKPASQVASGSFFLKRQSRSPSSPFPSFAMPVCFLRTVYGLCTVCMFDRDGGFHAISPSPALQRKANVSSQTSIGDCWETRECHIWCHRSVMRHLLDDCTLR